MFIDTHMHLGDTLSVEELLKKCHEVHVDKLILCGTNKEEIIKYLELADKYKEIYLAIGFHPENADSITDEDLSWLEEKAKNPKVVAIGEIGLDFHYEGYDKDKQINLFKKQIEISKRLNKPVVIHTRDAMQLTFDILKESKVKGVMHCYSGSIEMAMEYIKIGFSLGIGGVLTFKNSNLPKVIDIVPLENIVLETDSPYLAPTPHRGEENYSFYIPIIAEKIAEIKNLSIEKVAEITYKNAVSIFDID